MCVKCTKYELYINIDDMTVRLKHLDRPLVASCSIGLKPCLPHVPGRAQTKIKTYLHLMVLHGHILGLLGVLGLINLL